MGKLSSIDVVRGFRSGVFVLVMVEKTLSTSAEEAGSTTPCASN